MWVKTKTALFILFVCIIVGLVIFLEYPIQTDNKISVIVISEPGRLYAVELPDGHCENVILVKDSSENQYLILNTDGKKLAVGEKLKVRESELMPFKLLSHN